MRWIIKIEDKPHQRIEVIYDALNDMLHFNGQLNVKMNWTTFHSEIHPNSIDLNKITEILLNVCDILNDKDVKYLDISKSFSLIKEIEIKPKNN